MVEQPAQKRLRLVAVDANHYQHNGRMDKMENNTAYFEKDPEKGLNWLRNLVWSLYPAYPATTVSQTLLLQSSVEQLVM